MAVTEGEHDPTAARAATVPVLGPPVRRSHAAARSAAILAGALLLVVLWLPAQLLWLGDTPFHTKGEPREALAARDIVAHGHWVLPRRNGTELPSKPPAFHWGAALVAMARGSLDETSARLPSALASLFAVLSLYGTLCGTLGVRRAWLAAAMAMTSFEWTRSATGARVDMALTLGLTLSYCGGLLAWSGRSPALARLLFHGGMVWGTLAKGPIGIVLPATHALLMAGFARDAAFLRRLAFARGLLVAGASVAVWYALAVADGGREFVRRQILEENVFRLLGGLLGTLRERLEWLDRLLPYEGLAPGSVGHRHGVLYLCATLLAGTLPWTFLLPAAVAARQDPDGPRGHSPFAFAGAWALLVFAVYAVAASKRSVYLLGLYPALFTLLAAGLARPAGMPEHGRPWTDMVQSVAAALLALGLAALALAAGTWMAGLPVDGILRDVAGPEADVAGIVAAFLRRRLPFLAGGAAGASLLAAASAVAMRAGWRAWSVGLLAASMCVVSATARAVVLPAVAETATRRRFARAVRQIAHPQGAIHFYRSFDYGFVYYWGREVPVYSGPLDRQAPRLLLAGEKLWARLPAAARDVYEPVPMIGRPPRVRLLLLQRVTPPPPGAK